MGVHMPLGGTLDPLDPVALAYKRFDRCHHITTLIAHPVITAKAMSASPAPTPYQKYRSIQRTAQ